MKKSTHAPPTSLCLFALLCVRPVTVSLSFLSVSLSVVISQQIQFIQNEIVSCSSEFGFFFTVSPPSARSSGG